MGTKVYVGNLPFSVSDEELNKLFEGYEVEEVSLIKDKFSGRSKGFGFVTFASEESAEKAISEMNGKDIQGRALKVTEARPMDPNNKPPRRNFNSSGSSRRRF